MNGPSGVSALMLAAVLAAGPRTGEAATADRQGGCHYRILRGPAKP